MNESDIWQDIASYARFTPSPHNTQPFRLHQISKDSAEIVFLPDRGLYIGDPKGKFTWLAGGIFAEICRLAALKFGYALEINWNLSPMYINNDYKTPQVVATIGLSRPEQIKPDIDAELIRKRQTSRLAYDGRPVPAEVLGLLQTEASKFGHTFKVSTAATDIAWVKVLNKNSLFNDLSDQGIREELKRWLRFSKQEARSRGDGLSAECLQIPGWLLKSFFYHHRFWTMPGLKQIVDKVYLRTMKGIGTIAWLQGPYQSEADWVRAGTVMIRLWLILTEHGLYWHPYGSVITNDTSRTEMLKYLHLPDEENGKNMIWLLLRLGYSNTPPYSERLAVEDLLV